MMNLPLRKPVSCASGKTYVNTNYPIDCAMGHSLYGYPSQVDDYLAQKDPGFNLSLYHSYDSLLGLKLGIVDYLRPYSLSPDQIFLSHGSIDALNVIFFRLVHPKGMLGVGPQFPQAIKKYLLTGGRYHAIPLNLESEEQAFPVEELIEEMERSARHYSILYLDNPNNPTGQFLPKEDCERLIQVAQKHNIMVILDEAYGDFFPIEESGVGLTLKYDNVIVIRTFSKAWGLASIRCGYFVTHPNLVNLAQNVSDPYVPGYLSAKIAAVALQATDFIPKITSRVLEDKRRTVEIFRSGGYKVLPTHPKVPIFSIFKKGTNVALELSRKSIFVSGEDAFVTTRRDFAEEYARVRIVPRHEDLQHLSYRLLHSLHSN